MVKFSVNKKSQQTLSKAQENLQTRLMMHQERRLLIEECRGWSIVVFRYILILTFVLWSIKIIFFDDKMEKIIIAFTTIQDGAWQTQCIYGFVIAIYFISRIFYKKK